MPALIPDRWSGRTRPGAVPNSPELIRAAERILLGVAPVLSVVLFLGLLVGEHNVAVDFRGWYWIAGHRVLDGRSPYALAPLRALNYPAFGALLFVPFALIPHGAADWVFTVVVLGSVPASLRLLNVRDWRIYGIVLLWQPVIVGYETANVTLLLVLGVAACWHFRGRPWIVGWLLAVVLSVKMILLPIGLWLLVTRRFKAVGAAIVAAAVLNLVSWAIIGFGQASAYLKLIRAFPALAERWGYSLIGLALHLGVGQAAADTIGIGTAALVLAVALTARGARRDRVVFSGCVAACLIASPVVESHYLALILVPLALARPTFGRIWALPLILIIVPPDHPSNLQHGLGLVVTGAVLAYAILDGERGARAPGHRRRKSVTAPRDDTARKIPDAAVSLAAALPLPAITTRTRGTASATRPPAAPSSQSR
jgi:hypothetical protein